ncbi:N(6)-adenine-specific methyltransferase METTL4-like isoform X2 [Oculina patagonica]
MAVIGRCENGFLVDHKKSISETVSSLSLSCKESFFALYEPYFRSSTENSSDTKGSRKRKRKKSAQVSRTEEELEAAFHHQKVRETIATGVARLIQIGVEKSYFLSGNEPVQQNTTASALPENSKDFAGLLSDVSSCTRQESNHSLEPLVIKAQQNGLYDLLVLDPPWFNKSARRASKYSFMSLWQIKSLPVPHLLAQGALVGIWVTNKQKYLRFTKTELFPHWSIELVAEWYWVKVTRKGELVTDLDSPHKKPYEPLLLGRFTAKMDGPGTSYLSITKGNDCSKEKIESTCNENNKSEVFAPQQKRKKIKKCDGDNDNDVDDDIRKICCICNKNITTLISQEWSSLPTSKPKTDLNRVECSDGQLNKFSYTVPAQSPQKYCLNCHKLCYKNKVDLSDDMESLSDVVAQNEQAVEAVMELHQSKRLCETDSDMDTKCNMNNISKHSEPLRRNETPKYCDSLPYHQIICSVPCKLHSRKPPLNEILSQYVSHDSLCLEMFARNLTPHWTSWGNEVLRFQSMEYFDHLLPKQEPKENVT